MVIIGRIKMRLSLLLLQPLVCGTVALVVIAIALLLFAGRGQRSQSLQIVFLNRRHARSQMRVHGRVHLVTNVAAVILHRLFHRRLHDQIVTAGAATEIVLHRSTRHWRRRGVQISVTAQRRLQRRRMGRRLVIGKKPRDGWCRDEQDCP